MIAKYLLPALAAISTVAAQTSSTTCTVSTTTISAAADATALTSCSAVKGSVEIVAGAGTSLDISGPTSISGDLIIENNGELISLTSSTLASVSGSFTMSNVTVLNNLQMDALESCGTINWQSLPALSSLNFETGVSKASSVTISDTFLNSLDGISLETVTTMDINNNNRLTTVDLSLSNLSDNLNIQANGASLKVTLSSLVWIANMTIANVTSFSIPALETVNGSMRFDSNYFETFSAPNLTSTKSGDISFVDNADLTNISFPVLTAIGGGLLISNNTALDAIDGFPELADIGGAVKLRGNFTEVEFPSLNDVKGAFDVSSTGDISSSCTTLKKDAPTNQGGNNYIQGVFSCTSNNSTANSDTGSGTSSSGSSSSSSSSSTNSTAAGLTINHALLGLAAVGGFAQALW